MRSAFLSTVFAGFPQIPEGYKPSWEESEPEQPKEEVPKPANRHERRALAAKRRKA